MLSFAVLFTLLSPLFPLLLVDGRTTAEGTGHGHGKRQAASTSSSTSSEQQVPHSNFHVPMVKNIGSQTSTSKVVSKAATGPQIDNMSSSTTSGAYLCQISVGNGQQFNVVLDTGSSDIWVRSSPCSTTDIQDTSCEGPTLNLKDATITPVKGITGITPQPFYDAYGSGSIRGSIYQGPIAIGSLSATLPFAAVTRMTTMYVDGIIGIGFDASSISSIYKSTAIKSNFFDGLGFTGVNNVFGIFLAAFQFGQITLGGVDTSKFVGTPTYFPVVIDTSDPLGAANFPSRWIFDVTGATITVVSPGSSNQSIPISIGTSLHTALVDSGTTGIVLSTAAATQINGILGQVSSIGQFSCSALSKAPTLVFNLAGGFQAAVPPSAWIYQSGNVCQTLIMGGAENAALGINILGDSFMQNFYVIYSKANPAAPSVGLATLSASAIALANGQTSPTGSGGSTTGSPNIPVFTTSSPATAAPTAAANKNSASSRGESPLQLSAVIFGAVFALFFL